MATPTTAQFGQPLGFSHNTLMQPTPEDTELSRCPQPSNPVRDQKGDDSSANRTQLNHGGDVGKHVRLLSSTKTVIFQPKQVDE